jgi:hypothetical protein
MGGCWWRLRRVLASHGAAMHFAYLTEETCLTEEGVLLRAVAS